MRHIHLLALLKNSRLSIVVAATLFLAACSSTQNVAVQVPSGFVNLGQFFEDQGLHLATEVRYFGTDNFVGAPIDGYQAGKIFITEEAAQGLLIAGARLQNQGLAFKVFDGYRPQQAVDHFVRWAKDLEDTKMKSKYYPRVEKRNLFSDGYIAARSGHSRGSTLDLTLVSIADGAELDMGTGWDYFDLLSWPSSDGVSAAQKSNRILLREAMVSVGFRPLKEEWWHFTLENEPFTESYFNFPIR